MLNFNTEKKTKRKKCIAIPPISPHCLQGAETDSYTVASFVPASNRTSNDTQAQSCSE